MHTKTTALSILFVLVLSIGRACAQAPPTGVVGLPPTLLQEVKLDASLPQGSYDPVAAWSALGTGEGHNTGQAAADADAQGGQSWEARTGRDKPSTHMIFGPYLDQPAGDYVAFFRLKLMEDAGEETVATLDASIGGGQQVLTTRDLTGTNLAVNRYVQVPMAFHSPGGKLECRVFWSGYSTLRVDTISLYRVQGLQMNLAAVRAPAAAPGGLPKDLPYTTEPRPFPEIFPRSAPPAADMAVMDLTRLPPDWQLAMFSLQGLVNRAKPQIYALYNPPDSFWLQWMLSKGWIRKTHPSGTPQQLIKQYRSKLKGMVITDPNLPATKNVATMIAGVDDGLVVSPRMAPQLNLPVLEDLRGRWKTSVEAYRWAFDHLWPQMNHHVTACSYPDHLALRDYLVQNKVFIFWISGPIDGARPYASPTAEARLMEELFARMPVNTPVMSYPWAAPDVGIGEGPGVSLFAEFGHYLVGSVNASNLSVHSGIIVPRLQQRPPPPTPPLRKDKVYVSYIMSDGDNLPVLTVGNFPELWKDPLRGKFPIGWSITPSASMLIPDIAEYYYSTATPNDSFLGAVSGIGYTYPDLYGKRYRQPDRTRIWNEFLGQTGYYMGRMDLKNIWIMNVTRPELFSAYAETIPSLQAIFPDYGRRVSSYGEADTLTARNVPIFHAINGWQDPATKAEQIDHIVNEVRSMTPVERPAFMHLFLWNWGMDLPTLQEILRRLGPDYVDVRPDHLAQLFRQNLAQQGIRVEAPELITTFGGESAQFAIRLNNLSGRTLNVQTSGSGGALLKPARFTLRPDDILQVNVTTPGGPGDIHLDLKSEMGTKQAVIGRRDISAAETVGELPPHNQLQSAGHFEAERMSHMSGKLAEDPAASAGKTWAAQPGEDKPGAIVYGPYVDIPAGRYVALFRLKRTGDAAGAVSTLDAAAQGGVNILASKTLQPDDLPVGTYRSFPLTFDHPGGILETRVQWPGTAGVAIDCIDLWEIKPPAATPAP